jgi:flagellar FliL protein
MPELEDRDLEVETAPPKGRLKWFLIPTVVLLLAGGAGAAAFLFLAGDGPESDEEASAPSLAPIIYETLDPPLIGNIEGPGRIRFVQVSVVAASREPQAMEAFRKHAPVIRNNLIMLLSGKQHEDLVTPEGKEIVRQEMLASIQDVLRENFGEPGIESIYFSSFVMQ